MNFDEYMRAVEDGKYPEDPRVPPPTTFNNDSGGIINIAFGKFGGLALINSKPMTIRSNHYHKTDWHFLTVVAGTVHYYFRPAGSGAEPRVEIFRMGDTFFTPPMVEHAVFSPRGSEMWALSMLSRRHADHEADLVRVKLLTIEDGKPTTHRPT
jgi:hypothetical protein